jgi:hypothetical protein
MAEAKQRDEWARTSSLMALIANANRAPKKHRAFRPIDFDPFAATPKVKQKVDVSILKEVFIEGRHQALGIRHQDGAKETQARRLKEES